MSEAAGGGSRTASGASSARPAADASGSRRLLRLEDLVFTEGRLRFYGSGIAAAYAIAAVLVWRGWFPGRWVVRPDGTFGPIDFCWIWLAGKFAGSSAPVRIYDPSLLAAAQNVFFPPGQCSLLPQFVYPPTFLFFTWPLGLMPYLAAFAVWLTATFVLYEAAVWAIVPRSAGLVVSAASPAVLKNFQHGHNGFLTAGLIGLALAFVERRPWLSGILIGLLSCKPQFGVLFPLALLASRNWAAFAAAAAATVLFGTAAGAAFGWQGWPGFVHFLFDRNAGLSPDASVALGLQSVYGMLHWAGASVSVCWAGQVTVAALVGAAVWVIWSRPAIPHALKAASLPAGALLVTPYLLSYDLCMLTVAAAFLVEDGRARGFLAGERSLLLVCGLALFLPATPLAPILCAVLFVLIARRILNLRAAAPSAAPNFPETGVLADD